MILWSLICTASCLSDARPPDPASVVQEANRPNPTPPQDGEPIRLEDVVVAARRGSALVAPEIELGADEIDAFGAYDIGEALARISESLGFENPPIIIVNGRRVADPNAFLGFPPDALVRVEALPQQAAALYGGDPSRRVVNIVLQRTFTSRDGRATGVRPTAGGRSSIGLDGRQSSILENDTTQFGLQLGRDTALQATERPAYIQAHPDRAGSTLRPAVDSIGANVAMTRQLGDWSSSLTAAVQARRDRSGALVGGEIVESLRETRGVTLAGGLSGEAAGWSVRLNLDGAASTVKQEGLTAGRFRNLSTAANLAADRTVFDLPAGPMLVNLTGRYARFTSTADKADGRTTRSLDTMDVGGNLSIPLSQSRSSSLSLGGTLREADGARGTGVSGGLSWSLTPKLRFNGQWSRSVDAPNGQQRLAPQFYGEPRVIFDFTTGEAAEVLPLFGGNPDLKAQTTDQTMLTVSAGPFTSWSLLAGVNWRRANSTDQIGALPAYTPEVEAAFPERFRRDANGRLFEIDQRPLNIQSARSESLASSLNFNIPLGRGSPGARGGRAVRIGLTHSWQLANVVTIRDGLPAMDRLAGDGGGASRHQLSGQVDGRYGQWGLNASARWRSGSRLRRQSGRDGPDDLRLDPFATVDLRLSYLFEQAAPPRQEGGAPRRDAGLRLELDIDNVFDARPKATLGDGRPAPGYGRDDQDPLGRTVRLTLTRRF